MFCCLVLQRAESIDSVQDHAYEHPHGRPPQQAGMGGGERVRPCPSNFVPSPLVSQVLVSLWGFPDGPWDLPQRGSDICFTTHSVLSLTNTQEAMITCRAHYLDHLALSVCRPTQLDYLQINILGLSEIQGVL